MKKIAKSFFKGHPSVNTFFFTTDKQAFFTENDANNHACSLAKDAREVVSVTREEAEAEPDEEVITEVKKDTPVVSLNDDGKKETVSTETEATKKEVVASTGTAGNDATKKDGADKK